MTNSFGICLDPVGYISLSLSLLIMKVYKNVKLQSGFKAAD